MCKLTHKLMAITLCSLLALCACSSNGSVKSPSVIKTKSSSPKTIPESPQGKAQALQAQLRAWQGTPYRYGGLSRRGIDCSGFIHIAFRDAFGLHLPRSTEQLIRIGQPIARSRLNVGDLIFFKTGSKQRHVGIYIGNQQFIHASTSKGVMQSSLNNPYWSKAYWKSHRLDI